MSSAAVVSASSMCASAAPPLSLLLLFPPSLRLLRCLVIASPYFVVSRTCRFESLLESLAVRWCCYVFPIACCCTTPPTRARGCKLQRRTTWTREPLNTLTPHHPCTNCPASSNIQYRQRKRLCNNHPQAKPCNLRKLKFEERAGENLLDAQSLVLDRELQLRRLDARVEFEIHEISEMCGNRSNIWIRL